MVGRVAPEAERGGPVALVCQGGQSTIEVDSRTTLVLHLAKAGRGGACTAHQPRVRRGALGRYAPVVLSASTGATPE